MNRYAFIYNPAAQAGKSRSQLPVLEKLIEPLPAAKLFHSKVKGDIGALVEQIKTDYDIFVACGGDGTVQEIASKLINTDKILGIIPMGTGNDLCKSLDIPINIHQSFETLRKGKISSIDVGCYNDQIFLNSFGLGFDGLTNRYALEKDYLPPNLRYAVAAIKAIKNHERFIVTIQYPNKKEVQHELIMATFANGRVEGGTFWLAPDASVNDGKLNFIKISSVSKWIIPFLLPVILIKKSHWIPCLMTEKVDKIELRLDKDIDIHADGEVVKIDQNEIYISLISKGLDIICGL